MSGRETACVAGCGGGHGRRRSETLGKTKIDLCISASHREPPEGIIELRCAAGAQDAQRRDGAGGHRRKQQHPPVTGHRSEE